MSLSGGGAAGTAIDIDGEARGVASAPQRAGAVDRATRSCHLLATTAVTVKKVSIALGHDELVWARRRAKREGTSVSAVVTDAARQAREEERRAELRRDTWAAIEAYVTNGKPFTARAIEAADRELAGDDAPRSVKARSRARRRPRP